MSRSISVTDTAKLIRTQLKMNFPGIKFSVRSDKYAGGASIDISWTDGPLAKQVDAIVNGYRGGGFDGMIDLKYSSESWLMPDGSATFAKTGGTEGSMGSVPADEAAPPSDKAERVRFCADHIFTKREYSPEMWHRAFDAVCRKWGVDKTEVPVKNSTYDGRPYINGHFLVKNADQAIDVLIHRDLVKRTNYLAAKEAA
jgi:hypothetical protein